VATTLTSGCTNVTKGRFCHPEQDRALTLREAMLLQTFPADARLSGFLDSMALQVGNAVPRLLARRIGEKIIQLDRIQNLPASTAQPDAGAGLQLTAKGSASNPSRMVQLALFPLQSEFLPSQPLREMA
jgi:hypothetical protein